MDTETRIDEATDTALWVLSNSRVRHCTFVEEKRYAEDGSVIPEEAEIDETFPAHEMYERRAGTPLIVDYLNRETGAIGFHVDRDLAPRVVSEDWLYDFEVDTYTTAKHFEDDESITFVAQRWDQYTDLIASERYYRFPKG